MRAFFLGIMALVVSCAAKETVEDAARIARTLVDLSPDSIGTMATTYPPDHPQLAGQPFALQEYYASCHGNGSLTLLVLPISRHSQNIFHAPNHTASVTVASTHPAAARARVSLIGSVTVYHSIELVPNRAELQACYIAKHPDAQWWLPDDGRAAHVAYWARFDPSYVYFVGGFGDQHYIGPIPLSLYQETPASAVAVAGRVLVNQS